MTESRVSQLHTKAILRLKARLAGAQAAPRSSADGQLRGGLRRDGYDSAAYDHVIQGGVARMPALEPGKIRNVAVVGHRGTGKTSLVEAMLFQSGAINRLGTVEQGSTVSDWDEDEQRRQMSLAATLCHARLAGARRST